MHYSARRLKYYPDICNSMNRKQLARDIRRGVMNMDEVANCQAWVNGDTISVEVQFDDELEK